MNLKLSRQLKSCCSVNMYYITDAPVDLDKISKVFKLNEKHKQGGYVFIEEDKYIIHSTVGSNQVKISLKDKEFDISEIINKFLLI